ncbi:hypothetical protein BH09BAC3_BH09BAC3_30060 [soil metagenome]
MRKILSILSFLLLSVATTMAQEKKTPAYYFEKGEVALDKKEYITAQAHFTECLRLDNHFAEAYRLRAITREHLHEMDKALTDYNIYVDLMPEDGDALFSRAILRFDGGQHLLARQDFLKVLTLPKGETKSISIGQEKYNVASLEILSSNSREKDFIFNYLGLIEIKLKRYDKAIAWLDSAIRLGPKVSSFWINRGTARMEKKDNAGALRDFEEALRLDPENSLAIHNIAIVTSQSGESTNSEQMLTEAIEKNKDMPYPRAARAYQRMQKNDLAGALEDYNEVIRIQPKAEEHYINRGTVKEMMKDFDGARKDFSKAIELNNKNEKAWMGHGNLASRLNKWPDAIEDYTVVITLNPKNGAAYYNRALAYKGINKMSHACSDLKAAEKLGLKIDLKLKEKVCK